jgi:putative aldouronate transport system substrate-binding protein
MKKQGLIIVPCLLLIAVLVGVSGCAPSGSSAGGSGASGKFADGAIAANTFANLTNSMKLPIVKKAATLSFITWQQSSQTVPRSEFLTYKELEKRTNIHIDWKEAPGEKYTEYFTGVFAAGSNLPDMAIIEGDWATVNRHIVEFAAAGMIVPLEDLIVKNAPDLKAWLDKRPDVRKLITAPDGHIYTLPNISIGTSQFYTHMVRQDWLDKVKLAPPVTLDDWMKVLKAFRDNDPNGNGKKDEIQMILGGPAGVIEWGPFKGGFGLALSYGGGWGLSKDRKTVTYSWLSPLAKDYVAFVKRLYSESLLRREEFDDSSFAGKWSEYFYGGRAGIVAQWAFLNNPNGIYKDMKDPTARWTSVPDATGPYGDPLMETAGLINANNFVITKDCKDKVAAIKLMDYIIASKDGYLLMSQGGVEGETYKMVNGRPTWILDDQPDAIKKDKWGTTRVPDEVMPGIQLEDNNWVNLGDPGVQAYITRVKPFLFDTTALSSVMSTPEENAVFAKYSDGLWAYQNEMITKFVTGKEPMENWDTFVAQLKKLGAEEVTQVKQAQYDRVR